MLSNHNLEKVKTKKRVRNNKSVINKLNISKNEYE